VALVKKLRFRFILPPFALFKEKNKPDKKKVFFYIGIHVYTLHHF